MMKEAGGLEKKEVLSKFSPLSLAYLGDAVFELYVREYIVKASETSVNAFHKRAKDFVSAVSQAAFFEILEPFLTEDEILFFKKGRNAKPYSKAKNTDTSTYHKATGFETVWGFLYLTDQKERMDEIFHIILNSSK